MKNRIAAIALLGLATLASPATAATLIGDTVTCHATATGRCSNSSATVGNGIEFGFGALTNFDFTSQGLTISNGLPNGLRFLGDTSDFVFNFADTTNAFTSATLGSVSGVTGFTSQTMSLTNGVLKIGLGGLTFNYGGSFTINLMTAAGAVPEPASWAMMILGMGMIGFAMRRSNVKFDAKIKRMTAAAA